MRLAQADYHTGHYITQPDGHLLKHRDRTTLKIMVLIGIERYREGHYPALLNTYKTALWNTHVNAEEHQETRQGEKPQRK